MPTNVSSVQTISDGFSNTYSVYMTHRRVFKILSCQPKFTRASTN